MNETLQTVCPSCRGTGSAGLGDVCHECGGGGRVIAEIPKAAIEAAARAIKDNAMGPMAYESMAQAALTAAAPFMQGNRMVMQGALAALERNDAAWAAALLNTALNEPVFAGTFADGIEAAAQKAHDILSGEDAAQPIIDDVVAAIRAIKPETKPAQPPSLTYVDPTAGLNPDFNWDGNG